MDAASSRGFCLNHFACDTDDESDGPISPESTSTVPTPALSPTSIADSVQSTINRIEPLVLSAIGAGQNAVRDMDLDGRKLTITLDQEQSFGSSADFDEVCDKVMDVVGFMDVSVIIRSNSGTQLASCP